MNKTETSPENRYTDYDPWAWLYNKSEADLASKRLLPTLEKLLLQHLSSGAAIFDLCCGTGQVSKELVAKGYKIVGLDGSEKMLDYARQKLPDIEFVLGDARQFELSYKFDAVICTDTSLNHIMSLADMKSVFSNVYKVLKENGLFFFDLGLEKRYSNIFVNDGEIQSNYAWSVGETYNQEEKLGTFTITMFKPSNDKSNNKFNPINVLIKPLKRIIYNKILRRTKPSALLQFVEKNWQASEMTFSVKPYSIKEIQSVLQEVGFSSISIHNRNGELADKDEDKFAYFVARK